MRFNKQTRIVGDNGIKNFDDARVFAPANHILPTINLEGSSKTRTRGISSFVGGRNNAGGD
jgi:hypothetical protein